MLYTALLIGFLGSWHCVGMCGPIGLAIPVPREKRWRGFGLYHLGRIGVYSAFGALLGAVGYSVTLFEGQRMLTLVLGGLMILVVVVPAFFQKVKASYFHSPWMQWVRQQTVRVFQTKTYASTFLAGLLNGFLPCGLIYLAAAGSLVTNSIVQGAVFMALFGLGTLPGLAMVWMIPTLHRQGIGRWVLRVSPVLSVLVGMLLVYRGLAIDMPVLDRYLGAIGFGNISVCR